MFGVLFLVIHQFLYIDTFFHCLLYLIIPLAMFSSVYLWVSIYVFIIILFCFSCFCVWSILVWVCNAIGDYFLDSVHSISLVMDERELNWLNWTEAIGLRCQTMASIPSACKLTCMLNNVDNTVIHLCIYEYINISTLYTVAIVIEVLKLNENRLTVMKMLPSSKVHQPKQNRYLACTKASC